MNQEFKRYLEKTGEIGRITSLSQSIAWVSGLPSLKLNEMVICEEGQRGIVFGLEENSAEVLMLDFKGLKTNMAVVRTDHPFKIDISFGILGRIVNPLCQPIDGLGPITGEKVSQEIENPAPTIVQRSRVKRHLETGVLKVDLLVPLGYGQRELVIGDKKTGKTTFLLQTIVSQVKKGVVCIYVGIGKRLLDLKTVENYLKNQGVFKNVILVAATAADPSPIIFLAPYSGMSIAEFFRDQGNDVLIVFDDLTSHAKIYREIALLLKRFPGRSSYPGDIFHIHAKLLERAGNIKYTKDKEVSITALPVADTLEGDITGYIQTNLMAITDGHLFFDIEEFRKGARPAINVFLSVSRVGNQTKSPLEREIARIIRKRMAEYKRALEIARFGVELPQKTKEVYELGKKLEVLFFQESQEIYKKELQLLLLGLLLCGFWKEKTLEKMRQDIVKITEIFEEKILPQIEEEIKKVKKIKELTNLVERLIPKIELWLV
jgi:F-type H+-transporting ATPase subunit alpha